MQVYNHKGSYIYMISERQYIDLLKKNAKGTCTEQELLLIDQFLQSRTETEETRPAPISNELINSTFQNIALNTEAFDLSKKRKVIRLRSIAKAAAVFMLIASVSLLLYDKKDALYNTAFPVKYTNIISQKNKHIFITLPDGSEIVLNQNSKITYSNRFNQKLREVTLIGEAYFKVAKNKNKPFIVHSNNLDIKVLGTSFNIQAYSSSKNIQVALLTGKVWASALDKRNKLQHAILLPDQIVDYDKLTGKIVKRNVLNASNYIAWKDGKIKFSNTAMDEVIKRINVTYGCNIVATDQHLLAQHIYGEFGVLEQPLDVIRALCTLTNSKYTVKSNRAIILISVRQPNLQTLNENINMK